MKAILTRIAAGLLLFFVALVSAVVTLRLFLHGREVTVPTLSGLSDQDAAAAARRLGLNLSVENRFYSAAIAPNHVLSQSPVAGSRVRRGWQVRVTESLGGQRVLTPDVTGQTDRPATLVLKRLGLDIGAVAHIPAPSPAGVVLAQSPPPNTAGLSGPRVAILVSDDESATASAAAYVMPSLGGLSIAAANARLASVGLHIGSATDPTAAAPTPPDNPTPADPSAATQANVNPDPAIPPTIVAPAPVSSSAIISWQTPAPGHRVTRADTIRVGASQAPSPDDETAAHFPIPPL